VGSTTWQSPHEETDAHSLPLCPWTQFPVVHSSGAPQPVPFAFLGEQVLPPAQ
jgi:hypothetical protein